MTTNFQYLPKDQRLQHQNPKKKEIGQHICINIEIGSGDETRYYILQDTSDKDSEKITRDFCMKNKIESEKTFQKLKNLVDQKLIQIQSYQKIEKCQENTF